MPVCQVQQRLPLEANHVYVIAPDRQLSVSDSHIATLPFDEPRGQRVPIDLFFRSLAEQHGDGFAVVLSGGGSDGSIGIRAVKEAGGVILVQDPNEAEYASMPRSAIATGCADVVQPIAKLAESLAELISSKRRLKDIAIGGDQPLRQIFAYLKTRTGHDFAHDKRPTMLRRLKRRMQINHIEFVEDYYAFLRGNVEEMQALFADPAHLRHHILPRSGRVRHPRRPGRRSADLQRKTGARARLGVGLRNRGGSLFHYLSQMWISMSCSSRAA